MVILERILAVLGAVAGIAGCIFAGMQAYKYNLWRRRITWDDALRVADKLLRQIEAEENGWEPEVVIGLGRSGGIWGGWLAGNLGTLPLAVVDLKYTGSETGIEVAFPGGEGVLDTVRKTHGDKLRVLLIEGATSRGTTFREFLKRFENQLAGWDVRKAVLYRNPASDARLDFVGKGDLVPWPTDRKPFPWQDRAGYRPFLGNIIGRGQYHQALHLSP